MPDCQLVFVASAVAILQRLKLLGTRPNKRSDDLRMVSGSMFAEVFFNFADSAGQVVSGSVHCILM